MSQYNGISMETKGNMFISGNHFEAHIDDGAYAEQYIRGDQTKLSVGNNSAFSFLSSDKAKTSVDDGTSFSLLTKDTADLSINNRESYLAMDNMGVVIDTEKAAEIYGNTIQLATVTGSDTEINAITSATRLTMNNSRATMIGKSSLLFRTNAEQSGSSALYMNNSSYTLSSLFTAISANHTQLSLEASGAKTHSGSDFTNNTLGTRRTGLYMNSSDGKIQAAVGKDVNTNISNASFTLTNSNFSVNIGLVSNTTTRHQMLLNNGRLSVSYINNTSNINDKYTVAYLASVYSSRAKLVVNGDTGAYEGTNSINDNSVTNAHVNIVYDTVDAYSLNVDDTGKGKELKQVKHKFSPYNTHQTEDQKKYNHFRVDPSYMSVMNDIKLTSRGGARLSEALPNYILKGIYELSNSYKSGPWPCRKRKVGGKDSNCTYTVPYYSLDALGLSSGGWEFNCGANGATQHPAAACKGKAGNDPYHSGDTVQISYYTGDNTYADCSSGSFCWAHPFMGAVPAPGRKISEFGEANVDGLAAYDEGVCPDGYQAVITVTPTVFELGKVQFVNSSKRPSGAAVSYNPGWQNYASANIADVTGLMQMSTKLGLLVEQVVSGNQLYGWKIAMGTVTPVSTDINDDGYIWNAGGIPANSWSAIAHTYCYFNPSRFTMPNMVIKDNMIQTAVNPNL